MSAPTRRDLLGGTAALTVVPFAAADSSDAELIALDAEVALLAADYVSYTKAFFLLPADHPDLEQAAYAANPTCDRLDEIAERLVEIPAKTPAGLIAKARLLRHFMVMDFGSEMTFESDGLLQTDLAWSLVNDLVGAGDAA